MSKLKDLQNRTLSYFKKSFVEKEEFKFSPVRLTENTLETCSVNEIDKYDEISQKMNVANSLLIDYNLLKPITFKMNKIILFNFAFILWVIMTFSSDHPFRYFFYGMIFASMVFLAGILWLYFAAYSLIEYRTNLLEYYSNEIDRIRTVTPTDNTKFISSSRKRKGWVYLTETYNKQNFKSSDLVLAYAILQKETLTIYVIEDKFILKPRLGLDIFNNLIKKMKSCKKIAIDVTELEMRLEPSDLSPGRLWNKKFPIKITARKDMFYMLDVQAPALSFIDAADLCNEPFMIPSYHRTTPLKLTGNTMYLFGISAREKERWYYKILENCDTANAKSASHLTKFVEKSNRASFNTYMNDIMKKGKWLEERLSINLKNRNSIPSSSSEPCVSNLLMASSMFSLNVIFSRIFWDFWREQSWNVKILSRIQRTLDRIILPPYLKYLKADDLNIGDTLPLLFSAETPLLDDDGGFWINCPIYYEGKFSLTIHTQIISDLYAVIVDKQKDLPDTSEINQEATKTLFTENSTMLDVDHKPTSQDCDSINFAMDYSSLSHSTTSLTDNYLDDAEVKIIGDVIDSKASRIKHNVVKLLHDNKQAIKTKAIDYAKRICKSAANHIENSNISLLVNVSLVKGTLSLYFPPPPTNRVWYIKWLLC
ncbi:hypothetical protein HZS_2806 [Henneguya salminicola]|nr:hypothetical protein HZS_2806 [Henneguya salminicola]